MHAAGALYVVAADPISLALYRPPSQYGADIVVAEGSRWAFRSASAGRACRSVRLPRAVCAADARKDRGPDERSRGSYGLRANAADARAAHPPRARDEQHLHSTQLIALQATIYVQALGPRGLRRVAELCYERAHAAERIDALTGYRVERDGAVLPRVRRPHAEAAGGDQPRALSRGIIGTLDISDYAQNGVLLCVTEMNLYRDRAAGRGAWCNSMIARANGADDERWRMEDGVGGR
jgi:glycine dehydrogenase subunit 1